jgi:hypothetical protein
VRGGRRPPAQRSGRAICRAHTVAVGPMIVYRYAVRDQINRVVSYAEAVRLMRMTSYKTLKT